jgi:hypothetical protein
MCSLGQAAHASERMCQVGTTSGGGPLGHRPGGPLGHPPAKDVYWGFNIHIGICLSIILGVDVFAKLEIKIGQT